MSQPTTQRSHSHSVSTTLPTHRPCARAPHQLSDKSALGKEDRDFDLAEFNMRIYSKTSLGGTARQSTHHPSAHRGSSSDRHARIPGLALRANTNWGNGEEAGESHTKWLDLWILTSASPHRLEKNSTQKLPISAHALRHSRRWLKV